MSDDIVTRLRECWCPEAISDRRLVDPPCDHDGIRGEAADEIERLRAEEAETFIMYRKTIEECDVLEAEIERLRELMKAFVSAWERSELGENNGQEYFAAVHAMRKEVRGD